MALFDEIKKKVTETTAHAVKATMEFADVTKINSLISDEQKQIASLYSQLGEQYYVMNADKADAPFQELCNAISAANERIAKHRQDIEHIKGISRCSYCGAELLSNSAFCVNCGASVSAQPEAAGFASEAACPICGEAVAAGAAFCASCGNKLM
jgi:rubrerythrin